MPRRIRQLVAEFVATSLKSGRVLAHARTCRKLFESLKRKRIDPTIACVAKIPPKDAAVIY